MDSLFFMHILFVQNKRPDYVPSGPLPNISINKRIDRKF